ncbi:MAG: hypothetical protein A3E88_06400 [Legionellales bacterium RIFCSPHIGHO2_12_FULL_35_11]|nr:MAG: hypothetical protein A3E88_06400 [Legionellales bacterium RIFCSPHIGHO2_12_FULL_35_11]
MSLAGNFKNIKILFLVQISSAFLLSLLAFYFSGTIAAQSVLVGSFVYIVPNFVFARKIFRYHGAKYAKNIANSFYKGEAIKIALSVVLFAVVFKFMNVTPIGFFCAYISMQLLMWIVPLIFI